MTLVAADPNQPDVAGVALTLDKVAFRYSSDSPFVFKDLSLRFPAGSRTALMGRSGCGKSTVLLLAALLDRPTRGAIRWDGQATNAWTDRRCSLERNSRAGIVFQDHLLDPVLTVAANVAMPLRLGAERVRRSERDRAVAAALDAVGLAGLAARSPAELSGGQAQRVGIARALISRPGLLLVDEPTASLDTGTSAEVLGVFDAMAHRGTTVVISTHDPGVLPHVDVVVDLPATVGAGAAA